MAEVPQPTILKDLVAQVREDAGYYANRHVGVKGTMVGGWHAICSLITGNKRVSAYQESQVLEEATRLAGMWPITWEAFRGQYPDNMHYSEQTALSIQTTFQAGMGAYLRKKENSPTAEAVKYAKEVMARR